MNIRTRLTTLISVAGLLLSTFATQAAVPEPFQGHDPNSVFRIQYADVDAILGTMVLDVGRSTREVAAPAQSNTGTRVKNKIKRSTAKEGNRFFFEEFEDNERYRELLHDVRVALEALPAQIPLDAFSRKEQLAYWLNLYNVVLLDELVQIYPEKDLKKELNGRKSILDQKVVTVADQPLSLNDIKGILKANYDNDPMIMYGLFQGVIGGPNIRKKAYTADTVEYALRDNAVEFINSNRGTYTRNGDFEVSTLYEQNSDLFPNFNADLKAHLMNFIQGQERSDLQTASKLDPDIDDWTVADVYGTFRNVTGSFSTSQAALMDAVIGTQPDGEGGTVVTNASANYSAILAKAPTTSNFTPEVQDLIRSITANEAAEMLVREGRVTVEELGTRPADTPSENPNEN
ncbi:DUF547 domain-containing protein [Marinihelvus fidelis]|uniref:DUF547 domain-containing protein n=1 Tax=Marinihelvus fidelis TaxID=2613842 RepID=A0A5N0T504_9GAMM|nr:DUF547 domain-containing protein [Marinihelvus fidelis]KAA9129564.1 DUF547 domain-containing protein [Marinihelvus fidelis]